MIKIFVDNNIKKLEKEVNRFIIKNNINKYKVKFTCTGSFFYLIISYKKLPGDKNVTNFHEGNVQIQANEREGD